MRDPKHETRLRQCQEPCSGTAAQDPDWSRYAEDRQVRRSEHHPKTRPTTSEEGRLALSAVVRLCARQQHVAHPESTEPRRVPGRGESAVEDGVPGEIVLAKPTAREWDPRGGQELGRPVTDRVHRLDAVG